jgi:hypothetical protein
METSEHPQLVISIRTRFRLTGTTNAAVALRGRSTGWGRGGRPRRTFFAHHRINPDGGYRLFEVTLRGGPDSVDTLWCWQPLRKPVATGVE